MVDDIRNIFDQGSILGAAVAVLQDGKLTFAGGFGKTRNDDYGNDVNSQTLFAYASIAKTFCAVLVMQLVEKGLLSLDEPLQAYLPDLQFSRADYGQRVTLRHVLSHTTGLAVGGKNFGPRDPDSLRRFVSEQVPRYQFLTEPGRVHLYNSAIFCIAGHVAEAVTGRYYDDLLQEYLFGPLNMNVTFDPSVAMTYPIALPHQSDANGRPEVVHQLAYNVSGNPSSFSYGSLSDLVNYATMFLNDGVFEGVRVLSAESIRTLHTLESSRHIEGHAHPLAYPGKGYGIGFMVGDYLGKRCIRHGGVSQSYNNFFDLFPDDNAAVIVLTNHASEGALTDLVMTTYHHALDLAESTNKRIPKPAPSNAPSIKQELNRLDGTYINIESADLVTISAEDGLWLDQRGSKTELVEWDTNRFYAQISDQFRLMLTFIFDEADSISHVMIGGNPYFPFEIDNDFRPKPHEWQQFEGSYQDPTNTNSNAIFNFKVVADQPQFSIASHQANGKPIGENTFLTPFGHIQFIVEGSQPQSILVLGKAVYFFRQL